MFIDWDSCRKGRLTREKTDKYANTILQQRKMKIHEKTRQGKKVYGKRTRLKKLNSLCRVFVPSEIRLFLFSGKTQGTFWHLTCFRGRIKGSHLPTYATFQIPSASNTQYAKVPCFGMICSEPGPTCLAGIPSVPCTQLHCNMLCNPWHIPIL